MSPSHCLVCQFSKDLKTCSGCNKATYCSAAHQKEHWMLSHKFLCKEGKYIRGTKVKSNKAPSPNPLDPSLSFPRDRDGSSVDRPLQSCMLFKREKSNNAKVRLIKPGMLTPYINRSFNGDPKQTEYPYEQKPNQQVCLDNGKYRHIASFTMEELQIMGWDGAMYQGETYPGVWVPFVDGYDSDPSHDYEDFDINIAKEHGTIGINDTGKYMATATGLVRLNNPKVPR